MLQKQKHDSAFEFFHSFKPLLWYESIIYIYDHKVGAKIAYSCVA